jgi:hypothetical protein
MFLKAVNNHSRCLYFIWSSHFVLQQLDYIQYIDFIMSVSKFHEGCRIQSYGKTRNFGGYQSWLNRAGRYRSWWWSSWL